MPISEKKLASNGSLAAAAAAATAKSLQSCPTLRPHRRQPTRLPCPWESPGKNTGVGCHFLLQCMKVKSENKAAQSCPTRSDPRDCSLRSSYVRGIFQARVLEWVAIAFSNMLSRLAIILLPRSKLLLISWLQSSSAVILEHPPPK